jgi:hypothetical protein
MLGSGIGVARNDQDICVFDFHGAEIASAIVSCNRRWASS